MDRFKRYGAFLGILFAVPALGLIASSILSASLQADFLKAIGGTKLVQSSPMLADLCGIDKIRSQISDACDAVDENDLLWRISLAVGLIGIALIGTIFIASQVSKTNRRLLVFLFAPGIRLVMLILCAVILADAGIIVYSVYQLEATFIHRVHTGFIAAVGLGAAAGAFAMIRLSFRFTKPLVSNQLGIQVTAADQPKLWDVVSDIAEKLNSRRPDNIVLGLEPNFYATAANIRILGTDTTTRGETLYLSLPLLRLLSKSEMTAVIGHELGHFIGEDTSYTLRFVPVYQGLSHGLASLATSSGAGGAALLPAAVILRFCLDRFSAAERTIGRQRELAADKVGSSLAGTEPLISALVKTSVFAPIWHYMEQKTIEILNAGRVYVNLAETFKDNVVAVGESMEPKQLLADTAESRQSHPTDTHPTLRERADALKVDLAQAERWLTETDDPAIEAIQEYEELEKQLTVNQQRMYLALGLARMPEDQKENQPE
jgi:Zn-dependent protease with chaperone function